MEKKSRDKGKCKKNDEKVKQKNNLDKKIKKKQSQQKKMAKTEKKN